jgi:ketosteroid isomerase-like protein
MDARDTQPDESREHVEAVRGVYERWSEGDFRAGADLFDRLVLFVLDPEFPDAGTYLGLERIADYARGMLEPWTRFTIEADEVIDARDSVVVAVHQRGVGEGSGAPTEFRYFQVWSFRGARVIRLENFRERTDALEAAGIGT